MTPTGASTRFRYVFLMCFEHAGPDVLQQLLVGNAATRRVGLSTEAFNDLARFFENFLLIDLVEVPTCRSCLLGKFADFLV